MHRLCSELGHLPTHGARGIDYRLFERDRRRPRAQCSLLVALVIVDDLDGTGFRSRRSVQTEAEREMMQNRSLLLGIGIGLFGALAVLTARYVAVVLAR
jgi:hypothetical protein